VGSGRAYYQKKDYAAALTDYDAAIRLVPNNPRRWRSGATQMNGPATMIAPLKITAASSKSSPAMPKRVSPSGHGEPKGGPRFPALHPPRWRSPPTANR
jgi:hypothetical protein